MSIKFCDVVKLFQLVNFGSQFDCKGYICKETGKTYLYSEFDDNEDALPEDINDDKYLAIPYKNELNLGTYLVFNFVEKYLPTELEKVHSIFHREGAYAKYKLLLERSGKIEQWYKFEEKHTEQALREWCAEQDIEISFKS